MTDDACTKHIAAAARIAASYASFNRLDGEGLSTLLKAVYATVRDLGAPQDIPRPKVPINRSITDDFIVCLEDGKKLRTLKRYLRTHYAMSPEEYRKKWGLTADYPMVAPTYAQLRSHFAKKIGLGRTPGHGPRRKR